MPASRIIVTASVRRYVVEGTHEFEKWRLRVGVIGRDGEVREEGDSASERERAKESEYVREQVGSAQMRWLCSIDDFNRNEIAVLFIPSWLCRFGFWYLVMNKIELVSQLY